MSAGSPKSRFVSSTTSVTGDSSSIDTSLKYVESSKDNFIKIKISDYANEFQRLSIIPEDHDIPSISNFYATTNPYLLIRNLTAVLEDSVELPIILSETANILKIVTKATGT